MASSTPSPAPRRRRRGLQIVSAVVGVLVLLAIIGNIVGPQTKPASKAAATSSPAVSSSSSQPSSTESSAPAATSTSASAPAPIVVAAPPAPSTTMTTPRPPIKTFTDSTGAQATATLNGVRYVELHPGDSIKYAEAIVDLTLTGTSQMPFHYSEDYVSYTYGPDDSNVTGGDPMFDFTPYLPPNPLRVGDLVNGQSVRGLVALRMTLDASYILAVDDAQTGKPLAVWQLTSKK